MCFSADTHLFRFVGMCFTRLDRRLQLSIGTEYAVWQFKPQGSITACRKLQNGQSDQERGLAEALPKNESDSFETYALQPPGQLISGISN